LAAPDFRGDVEAFVGDLVTTGVIDARFVFALPVVAGASTFLGVLGAMGSANEEFEKTRMLIAPALKYTDNLSFTGLPSKALNHVH
jgi:hypothetical protein